MRLPFPPLSAPVTRPKKPRKPRKKADDSQLELPVGSVKLPAVVAPAMPELEDEEEAAQERPAAPAKKRNRRRGRARNRWWHRHWNMAVGLWFVPFAIIFTDAFFHTLSHAMANAKGLPFWMKHEFLMFALGVAVWFAWLGFAVWKWREPRPIYLYVLGHELTHAAVATLFMGRVKRFHATRDGGYIETNRYNFLIALAPYLWPFYSIPVLALWSLSLLVPWLVHYREFFLVALGFTWMFHLTFTLWMLPKGQTDFHGPGLLFSFTLIYTVNVILLTGALVSLAHSVGWRAYFNQLWESGLNFYHGLADLLMAAAHWLEHVTSALLR
jgi:hypothetical protein